tara:strand:+ start:2202 stop:2804 length:603 start_codon:yes stop_codon:yes gene_type:complete
MKKPNKILLLTIITYFALPIIVKAELTSEKVKAAQQKLFVLCGLNDGLDKQRLESEMKFVLEQQGINYSLSKDKDVIDRAKNLFDIGSCEGIPRKTYLFDWVKSLEASGESFYKNSNDTEKKIMESLAIATCKFDQNFLTLMERDEEINNLMMKIDQNQIDLSKMQGYVEGSVWYSSAKLNSNCEKNKKRYKYHPKIILK